VVLKIEDTYYLSRSEFLEYILNAYPLKWCNTRWVSGAVLVSFQTTQGQINSYKFIGYKLKNSRVVRFSKPEIDAYFMTFSGC
jgi:hypothetical protein